MKPQMPPLAPFPTRIDPKTATDAEWQAHVDEKLANFGDKAGKHGPLASVQVRVALRVSRETHLGLVNLARAIGLKPGALQVLALDTIARIEPADFFTIIGKLRKDGR